MTDPAAASSELEPVLAEAEELTPDLVAEVRALERPMPVVLPVVQAAAVAATGFVAGAATIAVVHHRRTRRASRKRGKRPADLLDVVTSRSFLVDVHLLGRR